MEIKQWTPPIDEFEFDEGTKKVLFIETMDVTEGVQCDCYTVEGDNSQDLGIIRIKGTRTPLQRVLKGERTVEGFISGKGKLTITKADGQEEIYLVDDEHSQGFKIDVGIGDLMQWIADEGCDLITFEICVPPYEEGRYENIEQPI